MVRFEQAQEEIEKQDNKKPSFREVFSAFERDFFEFSRSKDKEKRWSALRYYLEFLNLEEEFSLPAFEAKAVKIVDAQITQASKEKYKVAVQQFLNFLNREGF